MKKNQKLFLTISFFSTSLLGLTKKVSAQLRNPAVEGQLGGNTADGAAQAASGATFAMYMIQVWNAIISVGALAVILYFIWGAFEWITAGGDSGKVDKARQRILQAAIGLIILVSSYTIIGFLSTLMFGDQFNILNPTLPAPGGDAGAPVPPPAGGGGAIPI